MAQPKVANFSTGLRPPQAGDMDQLALEQALLAKALEQETATGFARPIQDTGAFRVPELGGLGNMLAAKETRAKLELNQKKAADVQGQYQAGLVEELRKYRTAEAEGPTGHKPYLDSAYPEIRGEAKLREELFQKRMEELRKDASFASRQGMSDDPRALAPAPKWQSHEGAVVNFGEGAPGGMAPGTQVTQATLPSGATVNQYATGKQSGVETAPKVSVTNQMPGQAGDKQFLEEEAKALSAQAKVLRDTGKQQLAALDSAEEAMKKGAIQGPAANPVQFAAGLLRQFGASTPEINAILSNTETLDSSMGQFVLAKLKQTGVNPSNSDREYAERTAGGKKLSPDGLRAVIMAAKADMLNAYEEHNRHAAALAERFPSASLAQIDAPARYLGSDNPEAYKKLPPGVVKLPGYGLGEDGMLYKSGSVGPKATVPTPMSPQQQEWLRKYGVPE